MLEHVISSPSSTCTEFSSPMSTLLIKLLCLTDLPLPLLKSYTWWLYAGNTKCLLARKIRCKVVNKFRQKLDWNRWICSFYHSSLSVVFQFLLMFIAVFITFSLFNKKRNQCSLPEIWSLLFLVRRIGFLMRVWSKH